MPVFEVSFGFVPQLLSVSASLAQSLNFSRSQLLWLSLSTSLGLSFSWPAIFSLPPWSVSWFLVLLGFSWSLGLVPSVGLSWTPGLCSLSCWSLLFSGFSYVGLSWFPVTLMSVSLGLVFTNRKAHKRLSIIYFFFIVFHIFCIFKIVFVHLYVIGYATFFGSPF